jgi:hypothetical protein
VNPPPGLEGWVEPFPGAPTVRYPGSPVPVFVDVSRVLPGSAGFTRADTLPLRVRAGGAQLEARMSGHLHCWLRIASLHSQAGADATPDSARCR